MMTSDGNGEKTKATKDSNLREIWKDDIEFQVFNKVILGTMKRRILERIPTAKKNTKAARMRSAARMTI